MLSSLLTRIIQPLLLLLLLLPLTLANPETRTVAIHIADAASTSAPSLYGTVSYNPSTLQGSMAAAAAATLPRSPFAKLGLYDASARRWRNAVRAPTDALRRGALCVVVYLGADGPEPRYVGLAEGEQGAAAASACVKVVRGGPGPEPVLNRPVVLSEDGKVPEPEPERTFLQK
ncbi:hypothetical protein GP486_005757 [Trichoglossum hirsutum]|uniref:Uncharacterized protein n=1 Tax=Trichoglossum hirsutum TaxID=265104 RepID=A0A9P8L8R7_9PEZI|nr:hypothetical protein GP486_005757 [Trichoglossum hirsutum]